MNDKELFELCKKCYEATGWECNGDQYLRKGHYFDNEGNEYQPGEPYLVWFASKYDRDFPEEWLCPLYTSDYLLDKLPRTVKFYGDPSSMSGSGYSYLSIERPVTSNWCASYRYEGYPIHCGFGDTPLEALLKLTIALHEEGIL